MCPFLMPNRIADPQAIRSGELRTDSHHSAIRRVGVRGKGGRCRESSTDTRPATSRTLLLCCGTHISRYLLRAARSTGQVYRPHCSDLPTPRPYSFSVEPYCRNGLLPRIPGFYTLDPLSAPGKPQLILGPFQGKVACQTIAFGRGVCGAAASTQTTQVVPDVEAFPGHIACDGDSKSEIVVPIVVGGRGRGHY